MARVKENLPDTPQDDDQQLQVETKKQKNKLFKKRNGWYYTDGEHDFDKPLPSVTTILGDTLAKPGLTYWLIQQAVRVALDDPSLREAEVIAKSKVNNSEYSSRGTGVHNIFAKMVAKEEYKPYPEAYVGYIKGIEKFFEEHQPKLVYKDKIIKSFKHGYAGAIDCVLEINGKIWLIDVKTGNTYPEHELQLAAYKQALEEDGIKIDNTAILLLKGNDVYSLIQANASVEVFLKIKDIWSFFHEK